MKKSRYLLILIILILGLLLSACGVGPAANSWPGLNADETLVYLSQGAQISAIRLSDGGLAWQYPEKADAKVSFYASPILTSDGQLLVGGYNSILYSLNPQNGQVNWTFEDPGGRLVGSPSVSENTIFVPSTDNVLYTLDLAGNQLWKYQTKDEIWASPTINDSKVYLSSMDHFLYALDQATGQRIWQADLGSAVIGTAALSESGVLYVGTLEKEMIAVDAANGNILNRFPTQGGVWSGPSIRDDTLFFGDLSGTFYAMDINNGAIKWQVQPGSPIVGTPLVTEQGVVFGTEGGNLIFVDFNGTTIWNKTIDGKLYSSPVLAGNHILAALTQAETLLFAFDQNGNQVWAFPPPE